MRYSDFSILCADFSSCHPLRLIGVNRQAGHVGKLCRVYSNEDSFMIHLTPFSAKIGKNLMVRVQEWQANDGMTQSNIAQIVVLNRHNGKNSCKYGRSESFSNDDCTSSEF